MTSVLVEGCVTASEEAGWVFHAGAHRMELCRDLATGGLTPDAAVLEEVRGRIPLPVFAMVCPGASSFRVGPEDVSIMLREIEALTVVGVDGLVLGVLDKAGRIDLSALRELVQAAKVPVTFHRAFDETPDPLEALEQLRNAGVSRILTSGGASTAWEGRRALRELVLAAGEDLVILGGGAVRGPHVRLLAEETGLREVHARATAIPAIREALGPADHTWDAADRRSEANH